VALDLSRVDGIIRASERLGEVDAGEGASFLVERLMRGCEISLWDTQAVPGVRQCWSPTCATIPNQHSVANTSGGSMLLLNIEFLVDVV
jgi:hypothetical protein